MRHFALLLVTVAVSTASLQAQNAKTIADGIHYTKLANTLREVDKSPESISLLNRAMPAFISGKSVYWQAVANELIGLSYKDIKDTTNALAYLQKSLDLYGKLKYVASGWGVNEVMRALSSKNIYAGIQFNATGVRVAIFKTKYESDFYEKDIKTTFDIPNNLLVADASNSFKGSQDALRIGLDSIRRYQIPNERIFVVLSSDMSNELARTSEGRKRLYTQLERAVPGTGLRIDTTFTPAREAELFTIGAIPRKVWPTTSALNVGNNSTMGGYFESEASRRNYTNVDKDFHKITLPLGINTIVSQIESKKSLGIDAYRREAQLVVPAIADSALKPFIQNRDTGLQERRTVGLGGDIVQALVAYLHPEKAGVTAVAVTVNDIEQFKRMALTDYKALTRPDLKDIPNGGIRRQAEQDINATQNQLSEKQIIAGALWLDYITRVYNNSLGSKRFVFIRNSDLGWVTGKFLETINNEYESTIAKGDFYTR
jgi:hypothetical protein